MELKRCAYLTMESDDGWSIDADLAFPHLAQLGWQIDAVAWRNVRCDWNEYTAVYVGTPWDYPEDPQLFLQLLREIDASQAVLVNDLALIKWTLAKTYLRDLEEKGADIVPSIWCDDFCPDTVVSAFDRFDVESIIIKPVVSTNATDTFLVKRDGFRVMSENLQAVFRLRPFVIQPFIENIQSEGEYSLFYFAARFSHAILKTPKNKDFRVQEEFGARIIPVEPEAALLAAGQDIIDRLDPQPVYARIDFVRGPIDRYLLMELELIEPSMYLRTNEDAPLRFAMAFDSHIKHVQGVLT